MQQREMVLGKMYNVIGDFCNVYQVAILSERQRERCIALPFFLCPPFLSLFTLYNKAISADDTLRSKREREREKKVDFFFSV